MKVILNGKTYDYSGVNTLERLLASIGAVDKQVAVMVNDRIVKSGCRAGFEISENDRVEVLTIVGGG